LSKLRSGHRLTTSGFAACYAEWLRLSVARYHEPTSSARRVEGSAFQAAREGNNRVISPGKPEAFGKAGG
jgi:hypothetical protein